MIGSSFPGYPAFLERAAEELGLDPGHARVTPPAALAAMANLCAQATTAGPPHAGTILKEAAVLRDRLRVATRASELMLDHVARSTAPEARPANSRRDGEAARPRPARPANRPSSQRP